MKKQVTIFVAGVIAISLSCQQNNQKPLIINKPNTHEADSSVYSPLFYKYMSEEDLTQISSNDREVIRLTLGELRKSPIKIYRIENRVYSYGDTITFSSSKVFPFKYNPNMILGDPFGKSLETLPRVFEQTNHLLSQKDWDSFHFFLDSINAWNKTTKICKGCYSDGLRYELELLKNGKYTYARMEYPIDSSDMVLFRYIIKLCPPIKNDLEQ